MQLPIEAFQMKDLVDYDISDIQRVLSDEEEDAIHIARAEAEKRVFLRYHQLQ
jgi:hypothetical protein